LPRFEVVHTSRYRYANPVTFGQHRAMLRPRDSHDLRLLEATLTLSPPANLRWQHDVFSNSICFIDFTAPGNELLVESRLVMEHFPEAVTLVEAPLGQQMATYPFSYPPELVADLGWTHQRHYPDDGRVLAWAQRFADPGRDSLALLTAMTQAVKAEFSYNARYEAGTQTPIETLNGKSGTCRDFALFMMEAARALGFAARFVTGYLYDPAADQAGALRGAGETHAWVQVFLPLTGWVEFDPTNGIVGGHNLIRIAVARDPSQAIPLAGTFQGLPGDFLGLEVNVQVRALQPPPPPATPVPKAPPEPAPAPSPAKRARKS
jgi:transglutaminase-like putative cysteine protease